MLVETCINVKEAGIIFHFSYFQFPLSQLCLLVSSGWKEKLTEKQLLAVTPPPPPARDKLNFIENILDKTWLSWSSIPKSVKLSKSEIYFADHQMVGWCLVFMFTLVVTPVVTEIIVCSATITNIIPRAPSQPASQRAEESCLFVSFSQLWLWLWLATIA